MMQFSKNDWNTPINSNLSQHFTVQQKVSHCQLPEISKWYSCTLDWQKHWLLTQAEYTQQNGRRFPNLTSGFWSTNSAQTRDPVLWTLVAKPIGLRYLGICFCFLIWPVISIILKASSIYATEQWLPLQHRIVFLFFPLPLLLSCSCMCLLSCKKTLHHNIKLTG